MSLFDKAVWQACYGRGSIPKFKCPRCEKGRLIADSSGIRIKQPEFSIIECRHEDHEPDWDRERFCLELKCDEATCGEISFAVGDTVAERYYDEEFNTDVWESLLRPRSFFPAPPIIDVPKQLPREILSELNKAFELYWTDLNATANRLRVSVELIMDQQKVPHETLNKKGVMSRLDLNGRIAVFGKTNTDHAETLTALRMIGNLGSHGGDVQREAILDAFEVFEDSLAELYGERSARLKKIKARLISTKGAY